MNNKIEREEILNFFEKNNNVDLSHTIKLESKKEGKNIFIGCATHGNEPVGPNFAYNFITDFYNNKIKLNSGSITFSIMNYKAFKKDTRFIDTDMNRIFTFPSDKKDSFEYLRGQEIKEYIADKNLDLFIDLHSVTIGDFKMYISESNNTAGKKILEKTSTVPLLFYFNKKDISGTSIELFNNKKITGLTLECGNHTSENAIKVAKNQVYILLQELEILDKDKNNYFDEILKKEEVEVYETISKINSGKNFKWLIPKSKLKTGTVIKKDQKISIDETNGLQVAEKDSYLFMPMTNVSEKDNDAGFLCIKK